MPVVRLPVMGNWVGRDFAAKLPVMDADTVARLNVTVEAFVKRCESNRQKPPFAALADCLEELRALSYWTEEEIDLVRSPATRVLEERLSGSR